MRQELQRCKRSYNVASCHPATNGYARPEVLKALLATPRSDFESMHERLFSQNSWMILSQLSDNEPVVPTLPVRREWNVGFETYNTILLYTSSHLEIMVSSVDRNTVWSTQLKATY